jgi:uncharacterized membrane-anchored protein
MTQAKPKLALHPLREDLYNELHARPFQVIPCPARVTHIALLTTGEQRQAQFRHLQELHRMLGYSWPEREASCLEETFGSLRIRREMHMEFVSYTFVNLETDSETPPFERTGISGLPQGWLDRLAGTVVAAFHLDLQRASDADGGLEEVRPWFEGIRLVGSSPQKGSARVWGTFRLHSEGFGRFMVFNRNMSDSQLGRLTQRLMEIETYRLMALLGLPVARETSPKLTEMDDRLVAVTQAFADNRNVDEPRILAELTDIAARIEAFRARTTFRFAATRAYHQLVLTRLEELREDELSGHLTISEFMTRRLTPAVKTCEAVSDRLEDLSRRVDRASDMMRMRVELAIQSQNQELLSSMERRSRIQLRMQHTVEGLSVVAISYYLVALLGYVITAVADAGFHFDRALAKGVSVPIVILLVWLSVRRIHHHFIDLAEKK